jgi:hypothetical protein
MVVEQKSDLLSEMLSCTRVVAHESLDNALSWLHSIDQTSAKESIIHKLRDFLATVATSPSVPGLIGAMTDAVRCLTWESLSPLIEDLFQDVTGVPERLRVTPRIRCDIALYHIYPRIPKSRKSWTVCMVIAMRWIIPTL